MFNFNINLDEYIFGEKFPKIANISACYYEKYSNIEGHDFIYADLYCQDYVLQYVNKNKNKKFKIIFHNSDWNCPENIPENCTVFSQNVHIHNLNNNIHSLPIGLENTKWFKHLNKSIKIKNTQTSIPEKLCYCNFNIATNVKTRQFIFDFIKDKKFLTKDMHHNGYDFDLYLKNISNHFFVLSPPGNGIDCHRTWETLYLKRIPIIFNIYKKDLFEDLPVVVINNIEELTENFLKNQLDKIKINNFNFDKLKMSYWIKKIKNVN